MNDDFDLEDIDTGWPNRAGKAFAEGRLMEFIWESVVAILLFVIGMIALFAMFSIPLQAVIEVLNWLSAAEWENYDWYWFLGESTAASLAATELQGANIVIRYILDSWISLPIGFVGLLVYSAIISESY